MLNPAHTVSIEELAERGKDIAAEMQAGNRLELSQGGRRIGEIVPAQPQPSEEEREAAWHELMAIFSEGIDLGGKALMRDEMHER